MFVPVLAIFSSFILGSNFDMESLRNLPLTRVIIPIINILVNLQSINNTDPLISIKKYTVIQYNTSNTIIT